MDIAHVLVGIEANRVDLGAQAGPFAPRTRSDSQTGNGKLRDSALRVLKSR